MLVVEQADRDAATAETAGDAQTLVVTAEHDRTDIGRVRRRAASPHFTALLDSRTRAAPLSFGDAADEPFTRFPVTARVRDSAPNQPPATNRMMGPQLLRGYGSHEVQAGTADSIPLPSTGYPSTQRT